MAMDRNRDIIARSQEEQWHWIASRWAQDPAHVLEIVTREDNSRWNPAEKEALHAWVRFIQEADRILRRAAAAESLGNTVVQLSALTPAWRDTYRYHEALRPVRQLLAQLTGCLLTDPERVATAPDALQFLYREATLSVWREGQLEPGTLSLLFEALSRKEPLVWPLPDRH